MVHRYTEWDKKRYKRAKDFPWWLKNTRLIAYGVMATLFIGTFGSIYKMQWFPPREIVMRSFDPKLAEDGELARARIEQREKVFAKRRLLEQQSKEGLQ